MGSTCAICQFAPQNMNTAEQHPWSSYQSEIGAIALAGSAGGVQAFQTVLNGLPCNFPVPVLICQHRGKRESEQDVLVKILTRSCAFPVMQAYEDAPLHGGIAYVAPPDRHLRVLSGRFALSDSPAVDYYRPSVDVLFESLAAEFGSRLIVVVLSGSRGDGAVGVVKVKACGGRIIVQEPTTALHPGMPTSAILSGCADFILPLNSIAAALTAITMVPGSTELFTSAIPPWSSLTQHGCSLRCAERKLPHISVVAIRTFAVRLI